MSGIYSTAVCPFVQFIGCTTTLIALHIACLSLRMVLLESNSLYRHLATESEVVVGISCRESDWQFGFFVFLAMACVFV